MILKSIPPILNILFPLQYIITVSGADSTPTCFSNSGWDPFFDTKKLMGFLRYFAPNYPIYFETVLGSSTNIMMQVDFESLHMVL